MDVKLKEKKQYYTMHIINVLNYYSTNHQNS